MTVDMDTETEQPVDCIAATAEALGVIADEEAEADDALRVDEVEGTFTPVDAEGEGRPTRPSVIEAEGPNDPALAVAPFSEVDDVADDNGDISV